MTRINTKILIIDWRHGLYLLSLIIFAIGLPTSNVLISLATIFLVLVWIVTGEFTTKFKRLIDNRTPLLIISIFLLYIIGFFFANDTTLAVKELSRGLPCLIFGLVLGSSPQISKKETNWLMLIYCITVMIAAIISVIRLLFADKLGLTNFREATLVDHMPFSFQLAFVIWIIIYHVVISYKLKTENIAISHNAAYKLCILRYALLVICCILLVAFLTIKSFNGYIYLIVMSLSGMLILLTNIKLPIYRAIIITILMSIIIIPSIYVFVHVHKFYDTKEYTPETIDMTTSLGNPYNHEFANKSKENGNYTWLFVCEEELIPLWNSNSKCEYHSNFTKDEPYKDIILRYMTSKGLRKDADGYNKLTPNDIHNIEKGMCNQMYSNYTFSISPRIYETIWEIDQYIITHDPNRKSLAQRIDLTILGIDIIKKHFWTGIGLGNYLKEYELALNASNSKLEKQYLGSPHNQYLSYMIRFGIFGTIYIISVLLYSFIKQRKQHSLLFTIFFISMLFANLGDTNFETFVGSHFFFFFFCLFLWVLPHSIHNPQLITRNEILDPNTNME